MISHAKLKRIRRKITVVLGITIIVSLFVHAQSNPAKQLNKKAETTTPQVYVHQDEEEQEAKLSELPEGYQADDWRIRLVNHDHPLAQDLPITLATLPSGQQIDERILEAYNAMIAAAQAEGIELTEVSGYRSVDSQEQIMERTLHEHLAEGMDESTAQEETARYVQTPGCSEHHTGLAIDITAGDFYAAGRTLDESLEATEAFQWLEKNAPKYGFILRYPKDKEAITQIGYEPWHFRYVGVPMAEWLTEHHLTLEELHDQYFVEEKQQAEHTLTEDEAKDEVNQKATNETSTE